MNFRIALFAAIGGLVTLSASSFAQPFWAQYGRNAQHTGIVTTGIQTMNSVLWQTPVDLEPPYSGTDLLIHYGSPLIASGGTLVLPVRTGPGATWPTVGDTYQIEGHDPGTGSLIYKVPTDFVDWMPHDWTPDIGTAIDSGNKLYIPGAGGTVWIRSNADSATATLTRVSFYGLSQYGANPDAYNANVQICTPLTVDAQNNVYFGFYVADGFTSGKGNTVALASGIARISASGVGTWVSADHATGTVGNEVATNCTPALSNDGKYLYVAVKQSGVYSYLNPTLLRLDSTLLSTVSEAALAGPNATNGDSSFAYILDDGTSSPTVGPDGDVYYGIWFTINQRGFMLHYSGDLTSAKTPGAFGWDDTAAIVPAKAVPGYTGSSSYLILTKYNNYADESGDGQNKIALLDPNGAETWTAVYNPAYTGQQDNDVFLTMNEIETVLGPTQNTQLIGVREWCINMAAIDVINHSAIVNSEDGHAYRWDFLSDTLTNTVNLEPPTGEAYTMTISGKDGLTYAINNATLFAMWDGAQPSSISTLEGTIIGGNGTTGTVQLSSPATGPGATLQLSSNNPNLLLPATVHIPPGQQSAPFTIASKAVDGDQIASITASRYGLRATTSVAITSSALFALNLTPTVVYGDQVGRGTLFLSGATSTTGRTVTLSCSAPSIVLGSAGFVISHGANSATFSFKSTPVAYTEVGKITATLDDHTSISASITNRPPQLSALSLSPNIVAGGHATTLTVKTVYPGPASGVVVAMTYSAHSYGPGTVTVAQDNLGTAIVNTVPVTTTYSETLSASFAGVTKTVGIVITPSATLTKFTLDQSSIYMCDGVTGTVTIASPAVGNIVVAASAGDSELVVVNPTILKGQTTASFKIATRPLVSDTTHVSTVSVAAGGKTITDSLTIKPITVASLSLSAASVTEGNTVTLTITTTQPAGNGDLGVQLKSSDSAALTLPSSVFVPQGTSTVKVTLTAAPSVASTQTVTITATLAGVATTKTITVLH